MPAPVTIRDPAAYAKKGPSAALGEDPNPNPIVPLRNFVSTGLPMRPLAASSDYSIGDDRATCSRPRRATLITQMNDTSMSPRLLGYVFSCISSTVSMISSAVFFAREATLADPESIRKYSESTGNIIPVDQLQTVSQRVNMMSEAHTLYFGSGGNLTEVWKVYGCIAISALLTFITSCVVIAHFDSIFCVKKNRIFFRDGSIRERNLILVLIILSVVQLVIATSRFSVGEAQANVFFSSWTNFISCSVNFEVWRKGSGRNHTFRNVLFGHKRYWFLLSIFATISFLSTIEFYVAYNIFNAKSRAEQGEDFFKCLNFQWTSVWIWLSLSGAVVCWGIVLLHRFWKTGVIVRVIEVLTALGSLGVNGYVVATFTGGRLDQVPCPSNLYFSSWGTFFLSVWIVGTMIQEGRNFVLD